MRSPSQRLLAVLLSVCLVTIGFGPAVAAPPDGGPGGPPGPSPTTPGGPAGPPANGSAGDGVPDGTPTPTDAGGGPPADAPGRAPPTDTPGDGTGPPAHAGPPTETPPTAPTNASATAPPANTTISLDRRGTALAHRLTALALLRNASLGPGHGDGRAEHYATLLNATREHVLDPNRTTSAALFRGDNRVVAPVHRRAPTVAAHLLISDSILAETAIADAERVRAELRARNHSFNESAVAAHLAEADRAYRQAERLRRRDATSPGAVEHYRRAWTRAQRALDVMDEAVTPVVSIRTRGDFFANRPTNHSINGTVFDVRGYELDGVVTFDDSNRTLRLRASTVPGTVAVFNGSVTLPPQPRNSSRVFTPRVAMTDPGADVADRGYDDADELDLHHRQTGGDVLALDGDGLPDQYERSTTRTDPRAPDSDSAETNASEAGNGIIDGAEDLDNDSLSSYYESTLNLDPVDIDTDGDALGDGFELDWPGLDPLATDADGDGRPDPAEDPDGEGLANLAEYRNGTIPIGADTDSDGVNDSAELRVHGTDPTRTDTDADGLADAAELELGTDPTGSDSDDDGVRDGNEIYERSRSDPDTGVQLDVRGEGFVAAHLAIENRTPNESPEAIVSPVVKVTNRTAFENATITLPIDQATTDRQVEGLSLAESTLSGSDLHIYRWDPRDGQGWRAIETHVDTTNGTATATVSSFSYFMVADLKDWIELTSTTFEPQWPAFDPFGNLDGWETEGDVSLGANHTVVLRAQRSGGGGGGGGGGGTPPEDCSLNDSDADCDADGLTNGGEAAQNTDPLDPDTDGDGLIDGAELDRGADPLVADTDGDGLADGVEVTEHSTDPTDVDTDDDGLADATELEHDAIPTVTDTDGDGLTDGAEVHEHSTKPDKPDTDGGGAPDGFEISFGSDPTDPNDDPVTQLTLAATTTELARAVRSVRIRSDLGRVAIEVRARADVDGSNSTAKIVVATPDESITVFEQASGASGWQTRSADLSQFAGQTVEVRLVASGNATLAVDTVSLVRDQDGDGIRDAYEEAASGITIPFDRIGDSGGGVFYDERLALDKNDPDTDDDGVVDGDELELGQKFAGGSFGEDTPAFRLGVIDRTSHPNLANTDGAGIVDEYEHANETNAFFPERLQMGLTVATLTDKAGVPRAAGIVGNLERVGGEEAREARIMLNKGRWVPARNPNRGDFKWFHHEMEESRFSDKQYHLVPATVFLRSNVGAGQFGQIAWQIDIENTPTGVELLGFYKDGIVYDDGASFLFDGRGGENISLIIETPRVDISAKNQYLHLGKLTLETEIAPSSRFYLGDGGDEKVSHGVSYAVNVGAGGEDVEELLKTTEHYYDVGITAASLIAGATIKYGRTGSLRRVARKIFWEYTKGQLSLPMDRRELVKTATRRGLIAFQLKAEAVGNELQQDLGYVNAGGPAAHRAL